MHLKTKILSLAFAVATLGGLTRCANPPSPAEQAKAEKAAAEQQKAAADSVKQITDANAVGGKMKVLAQYTLDGLTVTEVMNPADTSTVTVIAASQGAAEGIVSFHAPADGKISKPRLLSEFTDSATKVKVWQFSPASDSKVTCTYGERYEDAAVHDREINFHSVHVYQGALTYSRK